MPVSNPIPPGGDAPADPIDQLYVTHCTKQDSVQNQGGYSIRATSTQNEALFRFARAFPGLEKPMGMSSQEHAPQEIPRRLALAREGGRSVLTHTSYLPTSSDQRSHIFFSHFLVARRIEPRAALSTWASPRWQTAYPEGATQVLGPCSALPTGVALGDDALAAFLSDAPPPADQDLATTVYPARLAGPVERRRQLVRLTLQGYLLVRQADPSAPRSRLYIQAEPGLVALLLYAIARLLPPPVVEEMTFSTYEAAHKEWLRRHWGIQVLGTYTSPARALENDFLTRFGYGIDTLSGAASPELQTKSIQQFDGLLNLAAGGEWPALDELHRLMGRSSRPIDELLRESLTVLGVNRKLDRGAADIHDLMGLLATPWGQSLLLTRELREKAWPVLRESRHRRDLALRFTSLFREPESQADLFDEVRRALLAGSVADWKREWEALKWHLQGNEAAARFRDVLSSIPRDLRRVLPAPCRGALLAEWRVLEPQLKALPPEHAWLLDAADDAELGALARSGLPPEWVAQSSAQTLAAGPSPAALDALRRGGDPAARGFAGALAAMGDHERDTVLGRVLVAGDRTSPEVFDRLVRSGLTLDPAHLDALLVQAAADQPDWDGYWTKPDNLVAVLARLRPDADFAQRLWHRFLPAITYQCLLGDTPQRRHLHGLLDVRNRLNGRLPADVARALDDWSLLDAQMTNPSERADASALRDACARVNIGSRRELLKLRLGALIDEHKGRPLAEAAVTSFARCARGFYGDDDPALEICLELLESAGLPPAQRASLEVDCFKALIPTAQRPRALETFLDRLSPAARAALLAPRPAPAVVIAPPARPLRSAVPGLDRDGERTLPRWALPTLGTAAVALFVFLLGWSIVTTMKLKEAEADWLKAHKNLIRARIDIQAEHDKGEEARSHIGKSNGELIAQYERRIADLNTASQQKETESRKQADAARKQIEELERQKGELDRTLKERLVAFESLQKKSQALLPAPDVKPETAGPPPNHAREGVAPPIHEALRAETITAKRGKLLPAPDIRRVAWFLPPEGRGAPRFLWADGRPDFSYTEPYDPPLASANHTSKFLFKQVASTDPFRVIAALADEGVEIWPRPEGASGFFAFPAPAGEPRARIEYDSLTVAPGDHARVAWIAKQRDPRNRAITYQSINVWDPDWEKPNAIQLAHGAIAGIAFDSLNLLVVAFEDGSIGFRNAEQLATYYQQRDKKENGRPYAVTPGARPGKGCVASLRRGIIAFGSPGGASVCEIGQDAQSYIVNDFQPISIDSGTVTCLALSPKRQEIALGNSDGSVFVYDYSSKTLTPMPEHPDSAILDAAFDETGDTLAVATQGKPRSKAQLVLWELTRKK